MKKLLLILYFVLLAGNSWATIYYVDTDGIGGTPSDSNPGTIDEPWEHISKANSELVAGDTVYLRAGTYDDQCIAPTNNGTSGNYLTYENYAGEQAIFTGGVYSGLSHTQIYLNENEYIQINGIYFHYPQYRWAFITFCNHLRINDCVFDKFIDPTPAFHPFRLKDTDYVQTKNTIFSGSDSPWESGDVQYDLVSTGAVSHLLWENCTFGDAAHASYAVIPGMGSDRCIGDVVHADGDFVVVKNCLFSNKWRTALGTYADQSRLLAVGNTFAGIGRKNDECPWEGDRNRVTPALYTSTKYSIFRGNIVYGSDASLFIRSGLMASTSYQVYNNYIYGNTIYDSDKCDGNTTSYGGVSIYAEALLEGYPVENNRIINNIFYKSEGDHTGQDINSVGPAYPVNNVISHNIFAQPDESPVMIDWRGPYGIYTLAEKEANHADWVEGTNIGSDPLMVDPDNQNFNLQTNSPCLNAGTWLTTISSTTNTGQTVITVGDATPFYSGAGAPWLIEGEAGDTIKTEGGQETVIQSLDYTTNTLTVSPAIDIVNGEGLSLTYIGSAPDIGAFEYDMAIYSLTPNNNSTGISITTDLNWTNPSEATSVDLFFDKKADHDPPTTVRLNDQDVETWDCGTLDYSTEYAWRVDVNHATGTETGTVYYFTTTSEANPPISEASVILYHKNAGIRKYHKNGRVIK